MSLLTKARLANTTSAKRQLFDSIKDPIYRATFVDERVKSSIALLIRALRDQRNEMTQKQLGDALGMAQTWVSKLENPEYGKMTVATLLRLAAALGTDLEVKFRPFSATLHTLPTQGPEYFRVPSFEEEKSDIESELESEEAAVAAVPMEPSRPKLLAGESLGKFRVRNTNMASLYVVPIDSRNSTHTGTQRRPVLDDADFQYLPTSNTSLQRVGT